MSHRTEYDDRKRKHRGFNCIVTSSGVGGGDGWSGVDVGAPQSQQEFMETVQLTPQGQAAYELLERLVVAHMRSSSARG